MKKIIRILALIIAVVLLAMTLGACKPSQKQEEVQSTTGGGTESQEKEEIVQLTADVRIMSYNIFNPDWTSAPNTAVEDRIVLVRDIVNDFAPDVIGLQEAEVKWQAAIEVALCDNGTYKFACKLNNINNSNMTTFIYNTKTVKLIEEYVIDVEEHSDIRVVSMAIFEKISDGKRFLVTNTHPSPSVSQAENYKRHMEYITTILQYHFKKNSDMPIIMTGDFNTREQSEYYTKLMNDLGVKDAKYEAETLVRDYSTCPGFNKQPVKGNAYCIDHIFVNNNVDVKLFDVVIDHDVQKASDHLPIYADIMLKKR